MSLEEAPFEELRRVPERRRVGLREQDAVAALVEAADVLDAVGDGDEAADDVPEAPGDGVPTVPDRARPEGRVALRHLDHAVDVLEVRAAALEGVGRRQRDCEGEQRIVDVHLVAAERGVGTAGAG